MKTFTEIMESINASLGGTYAAVRPDDETAKKLESIMNKHNIQNPEPTDKLHSTLLYSRKHLAKYKPDSSLTHTAKPVEFQIWPTKSGKNCLVLTLDCQSLKDRHAHLMNLHKATYDFPEFKVHLSLSYDVGDFDVKSISVKELPNTLVLTKEYQEVLDTTGK